MLNLSLGSSILFFSGFPPRLFTAKHILSYHSNITLVFDDVHQCRAKVSLQFQVIGVLIHYILELFLYISELFSSSSYKMEFTANLDITDFIGDIYLFYGLHFGNHIYSVIDLAVIYLSNLILNIQVSSYRYSYPVIPLRSKAFHLGLTFVSKTSLVSFLPLIFSVT